VGLQAKHTRFSAAMENASSPAPETPAPSVKDSEAPSGFSFMPLKGKGMQLPGGTKSEWEGLPAKRKQAKALLVRTQLSVCDEGEDDEASSSSEAGNEDGAESVQGEVPKPPVLKEDVAEKHEVVPESESIYQVEETNKADLESHDASTWQNLSNVISESEPEKLPISPGDNIDAETEGHDMPQKFAMKKRNVGGMPSMEEQEALIPPLGEFHRHRHESDVSSDDCDADTQNVSSAHKAESEQRQPERNVPTLLDVHDDDDEASESPRTGRQIRTEVDDLAPAVYEDEEYDDESPIEADSLSSLRSTIASANTPIFMPESSVLGRSSLMGEHTGAGTGAGSHDKGSSFSARESRLLRTIDAKNEYMPAQMPSYAFGNMTQSHSIQSQSGKFAIPSAQYIPPSLQYKNEAAQGMRPSEDMMRSKTAALEDLALTACMLHALIVQRSFAGERGWRECVSCSLQDLLFAKQEAAFCFKDRAVAGMKGLPHVSSVCTPVALSLNVSSVFPM
jgi:hypothetical protein